MKDTIKWAANRMPSSDDRQLSVMSTENVAKAGPFPPQLPPVFHHSPCQAGRGMAKNLGLGGVYVKDESYRFGLNAFKVLAAPLPWGATSPSRWVGTWAR